MILADLNDLILVKKKIVIKLKSQMESPSVFVLILSLISFADLVNGQNIYPSENPVAVGRNVTLFSKVNILLGTWRFNNETVVIKYPGGYVIRAHWQGRVEFNSTTEDLTIYSVMLNDSGEYELDEMNGYRERVTLSVQEPVSNVTVWVQENNLVEFNATAVIMCSVSKGTSVSYKWLKSNSTFGDNQEVQLKSESAILTIVGVTRYDQGLYRCNASNGVGYEMSPFVRLNINYGPSNTTIVTMPTKYMHRAGSDITLSCLTLSNPPAMVQWMKNDQYLNQYGQQLLLANVSVNNSGNYKCLLYNNVTLRSDSASTIIQVMNPLTMVHVRHISGPAILQKSFTLQCDGPDIVDSIQWFKDDQLISANNTLTFGTSNKTLTLNPVQHSDRGLYQCQAFNLVSNVTSSPFQVDVNYGPEMPTIMGPNVVKTGDNATLKCHAESFPPSYYKWYFNDTEVSNMSEYTTHSLTKEWNGQYICKAFNNITNENSTAYTVITVVDPIENVQIEAQIHPAIKGHSYSMTCKVTGPADHIYWMKNDEILSGDNRTAFYMNNSTVMFMPVERLDNGSYQCVARNLVGNMTSAPYMLVVNYGPEMPTIMGPNVVKIGDNATLKCHAESFPPSYYKWFFNDTEVSNMSEYTTHSLTKEWRGQYICKAFNHITNENSTVYTMIAFDDPIENVQIEAQMHPAIKGRSYSMTCKVTGPADHIYWMKNDEILSGDNRTAFYMNNSTVMFMPVEHSDNGSYQCVARSLLGNMTSAPYMLVVNYGPEMPTITGPNVVKTGDNATLKCHAESFPPSYYKWFFNDTEVSNMSEYTTHSLTKEWSWQYICKAFNNITNENHTAYTMIAVVDPIKNVKIEAQMGPAIEGRSYNLTCNVTGPVDYIYWMKDGKIVPPNNTISFYMYNKTIMFVSTERSDGGNYYCMARNAIGNMTSAPYSLIVNFGPESAMFDGPAFAEKGSNISLKCSAMSVPLSYFSWSFKPSSSGYNVTQYLYMENMVSNTSVFTVGPLSLNMSGEYTCMVYNPVTGKNITKSTVLTVIAAIESVRIHSTTTPIHNQNFTLKCNVVGPYDTIYWMKDSKQLNTRPCDSISPMSYRTEKNMLYFSPLTLQSNGTYECVAADKAAQHKSPKYDLLVNYGPLSVQISEIVDITKPLTCTADSWPKSNFKWYLNNFSTNGPVFAFSPTKWPIGSLRCVATNPVTNITMHTSKVLTISADASSVHFYTQKGLIFMGLLAFSAHVLFH